MAKHTPGPWEVVEDAVGNNPDILVNAKGYGLVAEIGGGALADRRANARLIAAAPKMFDLLEAVQPLLHLLAAKMNSPAEVVDTHKAIAEVIAEVKGE